MNAKNFPYKRYLSKAFAMLMVICMVFTTVSVVEPEKSYAASGSLKVKSMKWKKASYDATLVLSVTMPLKVKVNNTVSGSNALKVTIQNTKTKKKLDTTLGKKGGTAYFTLSGSNLKAGTWKVISVAAQKQTTKREWRNGRGWINVNSYKTLKNVKVKKPSVKIKRGTETTLKYSGPTSITADQTSATFKATLKTDKGKPISGETVNFKFTSGKLSNPSDKGEKAIKSVAVKTDANGVATVPYNNLPKLKTDYYGIQDSELHGLALVVKYSGKAGKYCANATKNISVAQTKVKTQLAISPTWDGSTGTKTLTAKVVYADGAKKGQPAPNVPVEWTFDPLEWDTKDIHIRHNETVRTDANGVATKKWNLDWSKRDWQNWDLRVTIAPNHLEYAPVIKDINLKKKQTIKYYTIDWSKLTLYTKTGGGVFPVPNPPNNTLDRYYISSAPDVIRVDGQPLKRSDFDTFPHTQIKFTLYEYNIPSDIDRARGTLSLDYNTSNQLYFPESDSTESGTAKIRNVVRYTVVFEPEDIVDNSKYHQEIIYKPLNKDILTQWRYNDF